MKEKISNFVKKNSIPVTIVLTTIVCLSITLSIVNITLASNRLPVEEVKEEIYYCQACNSESIDKSKFCGKCGEADNWGIELANLDIIEEPVIVEEIPEPEVIPEPVVEEYPEVVELPDTDAMVDAYIHGDVIGYMDGHEIYGDKNNPSYQPFQDYIDTLPKNADGCIRAEDGRCYSYVGSFETWRLYKCVTCHQDNHNDQSLTCSNCN